MEGWFGIMYARPNPILRNKLQWNIIFKFNDLETKFGFFFDQLSCDATHKHEYAVQSSVTQWWLMASIVCRFLGNWRLFNDPSVARQPWKLFVSFYSTSEWTWRDIDLRVGSRRKSNASRTSLAALCYRSLNYFRLRQLLSENFFISPYQPWEVSWVMRVDNEAHRERFIEWWQYLHTTNALHKSSSDQLWRPSKCWLARGRF